MDLFGRKKMYKNGLSDAMMANEEFNKKQAAATEKIADDVRKNKAEVLNAVDSLGQAIDASLQEVDETLQEQGSRVNMLERRQKIFSITVIGVLLLAIIATVVFNNSEYAGLLTKQADKNQTTSSAGSENIQSALTDNTQANNAGSANDSASLGTISADDSPSANSDIANLEHKSGTETDGIKEIDMDLLVGTARSDAAYFRIFKSDDNYYFNFVVGEKNYNCLNRPVPLTADGIYAVAVYDDDNNRNSGRVQITCDDLGNRYITATVENENLAQYDQDGYLNALIFDHAPMYYDDEIRSYPIYEEYLNDRGDALLFLEFKTRYHSAADLDYNSIFFANISKNTANFTIMDDLTDEIRYQGTVEATEYKKEYAVLNGYDDISQDISIEIEAHYEGYVRIKTSDGAYSYTVFK